MPLCSGDILWIQRKPLNISKMYDNALSACVWGGMGGGGGKKWEVGRLLGGGFSKLMGGGRLAPKKDCTEVDISSLFKAYIFMNIYQINKYTARVCFQIYLTSSLH